MRIYTGRYADKKMNEYGFVPVGVTLGRPRFKVDYAYVYLRLLAPQKYMWGKSHEEFSRLYRQYLEQIGFARIKAELEDISIGHGDKDLILLCFEDVHKGENCHRRVFAEWWQEKTGEEVPEVGEPKPVAPPKTINKAAVSLMSLF